MDQGEESFQMRRRRAVRAEALPAKEVMLASSAVALETTLRGISADIY